MAESLHQGMAQWVQCKLGKQYLEKKFTLPWESNPGPTPNRGDLATLVASVGLHSLITLLKRLNTSTSSSEEEIEMAKATGSKMVVLKRDGRSETVHFDKITSRIT